MTDEYKSLADDSWKVWGELSCQRSERVVFSLHDYWLQWQPLCRSLGLDVEGGRGQHPPRHEVAEGSRNTECDCATCWRAALLAAAWGRTQNWILSVIRHAAVTDSNVSCFKWIPRGEMSSLPGTWNGQMAALDYQPLVCFINSWSFTRKVGILLEKVKCLDGYPDIVLFHHISPLLVVSLYLALFVFAWL